MSEDKWFLSQTNDDHWTGVCTARCQASRSRISKIGQNKINPSTLREVLEVYPNLNEHGIYNTMMIPGKHTFNVENIESDLPDPDINFLKPRSISKYDFENNITM